MNATTIELNNCFRFSLVKRYNRYLWEGWNMQMLRMPRTKSKYQELRGNACKELQTKLNPSSYR